MRSRRYGRRSIRLKGYDYFRPGAYFVTINTKNRLQFFNDDLIHAIAATCLQEIPDHFPFTSLDDWVVMHDHVHFFLFLHPRLGRHHRMGVQLHAHTVTKTHTMPHARRKRAASVQQGAKTPTSLPRYRLREGRWAS